jgi:hypothetical protein
MISFRIDIDLLDRINNLKDSKTDVIQKALELYLQNLKEYIFSYNENGNTDKNIIINSDNHLEKLKSSVQIVDNYELLRHYKEEIEWLRDRVEYFESNCKCFKNDARSDLNSKKGTAISLYRM